MIELSKTIIAFSFFNSIYSLICQLWGAKDLKAVSGLLSDQGQIAEILPVIQD